MKTRRLWYVAVCLVLSTRLVAAADVGRATVREYRKVFRTYPYSDPNPIPAPGRLYPYFRFEGYTDRPVDREWTVVELENAYLKVTILPEIGGKIWTAIEKSAGREFLYNNHVVKFRDVSMRGPWTSGGIEINYGIFGHTPNCASPVDYLTRIDPDGSATVVIGVLDLLTRTPWRLEITLPSDKAYFTTRSFWYNATPLEQPYYSWMNAGIKAAGNLELIYPGNRYLGHDGEAAPWPINPANGKNQSFYEQNNFGSYKSYHVFGRYTDFFGAYWHDDDFGIGRYSRRDDKFGKKAWIWGLSRQGMIWEKLLTDQDGQYVELQSGRLFNQSDEKSTFSPFKHRGFAPYSADTWTEYWFPVKGTGGFVKANEYGALNVERQSGGAGQAETLTLRFSPLQRLTDKVEVLDGDRVMYTAALALKPMQTWVHTIAEPVSPQRLVVRIGGNRFEYRAGEDGALSRPVESPAGFDWESVFGLYLKGKEWIRQREYGQAQTALEACLLKDPNYLPALTDLAMVRYRAMDYQGAWMLARKALAIDTYDGAANFYYGLSSRRLGRTIDAMDGLEVAALSPDFRVAAWTELAKGYLTQGDLASAEAYATRSLDVDRMNVEGYQVVAVAERLQGHRERAAAALQRILVLDPLNHFARAERYLLRGDPISRDDFVSRIRNEMPHETFLELAVWYHGLGRSADAKRVLALSPVTAETLYWLAFIESEQHKPEFQESLRKADAASPRLVFPFRSETADVLRWATGQSASWRPKYYLALILWSRNDLAGARDLLARCGSEPDYAPFYAARARAADASSRERSLADLLRAAELDPREWRFGELLAGRYIKDGAYGKALEMAGRTTRK
ncbi:MAG: DUF5107 domain-containing protein [Acidobacteria bacterium]|nr:DUF5107 domain-containing protein [Acidobacteriota bacterium]